jgi:hypothetical protein
MVREYKFDFMYVLCGMHPLNLRQDKFFNQKNKIKQNMAGFFNPYTTRNMRNMLCFVPVKRS